MNLLHKQLASYYVRFDELTSKGRWSADEVNELLWYIFELEKQLEL